MKKLALTWLLVILLSSIGGLEANSASSISGSVEESSSEAVGEDVGAAEKLGVSYRRDEIDGKEGGERGIALCVNVRSGVKSKKEARRIHVIEHQYGPRLMTFLRMKIDGA